MLAMHGERTFVSQMRPRTIRHIASLQKKAADRRLDLNPKMNSQIFFCFLLCFALFAMLKVKHLSPVNID